jgi:hypothetical protein
MRSVRLRTAGEAENEFLAPHILWGSEGGQEFIDRSEVAAVKMRVRHRFDGFHEAD